MVIKKHAFKNGVTVSLFVAYAPWGKSGVYMAQTMFNAVVHSAKLGVYIHCMTPYSDRGFERYDELFAKESSYEKYLIDRGSI